MPSQTLGYIRAIHVPSNLSLPGAATSIIFVVTNVLSEQKQQLLWWQIFVATKIIFCPDKTFVATSILLSWQTRICRDKTFVATKMILGAVPANDSWGQNASALRGMGKEQGARAAVWSKLCLNGLRRFLHLVGLTLNCRDLSLPPTTR